MLWRLLIKKGGSKVNKVRVRKNTETGLWQVEVASPTAKDGFIVQAEWITEFEARLDAQNWARE